MVTQVRPASTDVTARVGPRRLGFLEDEWESRVIGFLNHQLLGDE